MNSNEKLKLRTKLVVLMHTREAQKGTASGPRVLEILEDAQLALYGKRDQPLDLRFLTEEGRRLFILFPSEGARALSPALLQEDDRAVTLIVPDGNWRQASRSHKRVPGLEAAERVALPEPNLETLQAISRALNIIEPSERLPELDALFATVVPQAEPQSSICSTEGVVPALEVIHQDEFLVAVNKPSGMLVHRGWANDARPALQLLRDQIGRKVFPLHRLDRATSGVLLFALSSEVARDMQQRFEANLIEKRYLALCRGNQLETQRLNHPLSPEKGAARVPAITDLRLIGSFERYGLVEAIPHTGRTHQIRKHLKHLSLPIIGDVRYGKGEHNRVFRERFGFSRLALHCEKMAFLHPRSGLKLEISARLPTDFAALLEQLQLDPSTEKT